MKNEFLPIFRFVVCSDAHIQGIGSPGYNRLKKLIDYSLDYASKNENYKKIDCFFVAGDITNRGTAEEFAAFKEIFDYATEKKQKLLCTVAKGHDSIAQKKKSLSIYKGITGMEPDFHSIIGGYHFIGLSTCRGRKSKHYSFIQKIWIKKELKSAVAKSEGNPVFVLHHEHVKNTVYGSSDFDGWGNRFFTGLFEKYPNIVDFSGHSHYPVNDPRSVWQKEFTAVGTGSLKYVELTVDDERKVHPPTCEDCASFLIAEADKDHNLRIIGIDCEAEEILCEYYFRNPADINNREYTAQKQLSRASAPLFSRDTEITVSERDGVYYAEYPKAESTDGMPVFLYRVYAYGENGDKVFEGKSVPSYYLYKVEDMMSTELGKLPKGKYKIKLLAENVYGMKSECVEKDIEV